MDTSKVVIIVALAVYLLLPCKTAIGGEIACEVDDPYGHCRSRSKKCIDEHRAEESSCRDEQRTNAAEANKHWKPDSQQVCPCNSEGWSVSSASEAARCRPDVVNVTFHQFSNKVWYIVEVYWKYTEPCGSLVGVQVRLDDAGMCSNDKKADGQGRLSGNFPDCCYCVSTNHTVGMEGRQNFTVQYLSHYSATATVVSFPVVHGSGVSYATSSNAFTRPTNCYDPRLPADLARCGMPLYDPPTTFRQTHTSVSNDYSEANVTLSWDPPNQYPYPIPTHYYVRIRADSNSTPWPSCSGDTRCFKVTNSSELTFTHLNASKTYYVRMGAYHRCSGFVDSAWKRGCGDDNAAGFMLMWPSTNETVVVETTGGNPTSGGTAIIIGVCVAVTCSCILLIAISVCLLVYCKIKHPTPGKRKGSCSPPSPTDLLLFPRNPYTGEQNGSPVADISSYPSVLVVYSDKTHEEEKAKIFQTLIGTLRDKHGIHSTCHDYFDRSDSMVYQTANHLKQASAVLCVCNPAFTDDWTNERPPPVINTLKQIVAANISSGGNLSNYATVFTYARDKEICIPHEFFKNTRQFLIDDMEGIVQFVRTVPRK